MPRRRWFGWLFFAFLAGLTWFSYVVVQPRVPPLPTQRFAIPGKNLHIFHSAWSPDGSLFAAWDLRIPKGFYTGAGPIYVWETSTGKLAATLPFPGDKVLMAKIAPDNRSMLVQNGDDLIRVSLPHGTEMKRWRIGDGLQSRTLFDFSPDGKRAAFQLRQDEPSGSVASYTIIWGFEQDREEHRILSATHGCFSPDGQRLAYYSKQFKVFDTPAAATSEGKGVHLLDLNSKNDRHLASRPAGFPFFADVIQVGFAADGRRLFSVEYEGGEGGVPAAGNKLTRTISIWNAETGERTCSDPQQRNSQDIFHAPLSIEEGSIAVPDGKDLTFISTDGKMTPKRASVAVAESADELTSVQATPEPSVWAGSVSVRDRKMDWLHQVLVRFKLIKPVRPKGSCDLI